MTCDPYSDEPELTFEQVHSELVSIARQCDVWRAKVRVDVRCGVKAGRKRCGRPLGVVVGSGFGPVWRPLDESEEDPNDCAPGRLPLFLGFSPEQRQHFCSTLFAECDKHGTWNLACTELAREYRNAIKSRSTKSYFPERAIPLEWGPLVNNIKYWTLAEAEEAIDIAYKMFEDKWPPDGQPFGRRESKARARALVLLRLWLEQDGEKSLAQIVAEHSAT